MVTLSVEASHVTFNPVAERLLTVTFFGAVGFWVSTAAVTFTVTVAVLPLWVLAVMVAVPVLLAVTTPDDRSTVATAVLLLNHVTLLLVALLGSTVAVSVVVAPTVRFIGPVGLMLTPVAGTDGAGSVSL